MFCTFQPCSLKKGAYRLLCKLIRLYYFKHFKIVNSFDRINIVWSVIIYVIIEIMWSHISASFDHALQLLCMKLILQNMVHRKAHMLLVYDWLTHRVKVCEKKKQMHFPWRSISNPELAVNNLTVISVSCINIFS